MRYMIYQILIHNVILALYFATKIAVLGRPYTFVQKAVYIQNEYLKFTRTLDNELNGLCKGRILYQLNTFF